MLGSTHHDGFALEIEHMARPPDLLPSSPAQVGGRIEWMAARAAREGRGESVSGSLGGNRAVMTSPVLWCADPL